MKESGFAGDQSSETDVETPAERSARMSALAKRRWDAVRAAKDAEPETTTAPASGSGAVVEERDRALALRTARAIARGDGRDADKLVAAKLLAGVEQEQAQGQHPTLAALDGLPLVDLERLVRTLA